MTDGTRWAWARLNADTLFLVLLATFSGIFDIIDPARDDVTAAVLDAGGAPFHLHYIRAGAYVVCGLLLLAALLRSSVRLEVVARCLLVSAVVLNVGRHSYVLGWTDSSTLAQMVLVGVLALVTALRLSVLLGKRGLLVSQPAAHEDGP